VFQPSVSNENMLNVNITVKGCEMKLKSICVTLVAAYSGASLTQAQSVTLEFSSDAGGCGLVMDTYLNEAMPDTAFGEEIICFQDGCESPINDALLGFFGIFGNQTHQVPSKAIILNATLHLHVVNSGSNDVVFHRMLLPWTEAQTWNACVNGFDLDDCEAVVEPDALMAAGASGIVQVDVTSSVAAWASGASNYGWIIPGCRKNGSPDATGFSATEEPDVNLRPRLVITFIPSCAADIVPSGTIDVDDLLAVINNWGMCK
jgi:hypothetical protein